MLLQSLCLEFIYILLRSETLLCSGIGKLLSLHVGEFFNCHSTLFGFCGELLLHCRNLLGGWTLGRHIAQRSRSRSRLNIVVLGGCTESSLAEDAIGGRQSGQIYGFTKAEWRGVAVGRARVAITYPKDKISRKPAIRAGARGRCTMSGPTSSFTNAPDDARLDANLWNRFEATGS